MTAATTHSAPMHPASTEPATSTEVRDTTVRALRKPGGGWYVLAGFFSVIVLFGIFAWIHQMRYGMGSAGFNDHAFWAIDLANVITFIGVSYGGAVVSAVLRLTGATWRAPLTRLAEGTAVCTVIVGGALLIPHIARPERVYGMIIHPNTSAPVFWDMIAVTTYMAASIVFFALPLMPDMAILHAHDAKGLGKLRARLYERISRGWIGAPKQRQVLAGALGLISIMVIPLAVSVHSVLAWAFATTSRPWWHESIWAPQFVVAALYSGVAIVILVCAGFRRAYGLQAFITERHFIRLGFIMAAFGAAYLYLTFADILPGAYVGENSVADVFGELLVGRLAPVFWLFIMCGSVIPLVLIALPWTRNIVGICVASSMIIPMMWMKRMLMVVVPGNYDVVTGDSGSFHFTWVSVGITLGATAAVPLLLMLLFRVVPVLSIDEIEEIAEEEEMERAEIVAEHQRAQAATPIERPAVPVQAGVSVRSAAARASGAVVVLLLVATFGLVGVKTSGPASAATAPAGPAIKLTGTQQGGAVHLSAKLTDEKGAPVTAGDVTFSLETTVFGPRSLVIGSVAPDKTGTATLVLDDPKGYRPTTNGPQEFTASFVAKPGDPPATSSVNVEVTTARSAYTPAPNKVLGGAGHNLVIGLFLTIGTVWLLLIAQVGRVLRVVKAPPRRAPIRTAATSRA
jgi:Ni/Fe-hydrogenase subunit HybB-like protein